MGFLKLICEDIALIPISTEVRAVIEPAMLFLMVVLSVIMVVTILKQSGDPQDITAITGGSSETFYGKNKGRGKDAFFKRFTIIVAILLVVVSVVYFLFQLNIPSV